METTYSNGLQFGSVNILTSKLGRKCHIFMDHYILKIASRFTQTKKVNVSKNSKADRSTRGVCDDQRTCRYHSFCDSLTVSYVCPIIAISIFTSSNVTSIMYTTKIICPNTTILRENVRRKAKIRKKSCT